MFTRALSALFIIVLLTTHASAQKPVASAKSRSTANRTKGKSPAQSVAAYTPKVKSALAARWATALAPRMSEFATGEVMVTFKLDGAGAVADFAVTANTSNEPFAKFCEEFVRATKFEKPPAGALTDGQIEIPFTFTIL